MAETRFLFLNPTFFIFVYNTYSIKPVSGSRKSVSIASNSTPSYKSKKGISKATLVIYKTAFCPSYSVKSH